MSASNPKPKIKRPTHPWRLWIPKRDKAEEQSKGEKIPKMHRMGVRL